MASMIVAMGAWGYLICPAIVLILACALMFFMDHQSLKSGASPSGHSGSGPALAVLIAACLLSLSSVIAWRFVLQAFS